MSAALLVVRRYWSIGGNHTRAAKYKVCADQAGGDWDKLAAKTLRKGGLTLHPFKRLCYTVGAIGIGLTVQEAREVRPIKLEEHLRTPVALFTTPSHMSYLPSFSVCFTAGRASQQATGAAR